MVCHFKGFCQQGNQVLKNRHTSIFASIFSLKISRLQCVELKLKRWVGIWMKNFPTIFCQTKVRSTCCRHLLKIPKAFVLLGRT